MERLSLILVAAGEGRRLGGSLRKALVPIAGRPLLLHTLEAMQALPYREETILVVHPADREGVESDWGEHLSRLGTSRIVSGGKKREDSVRAGLDEVSPRSTLVAIHDAARPFVRGSDLTAVVEAAAQKGAALLAMPVGDTIKAEGEGMCIARTLPRKGLWLAQTPQVFRREIILEAHRRLTGPVTDDAEAVERGGWEVALVPSTSPNWKITNGSDLDLARRVLGPESPDPPQDSP